MPCKDRDYLVWGAVSAVGFPLSPVVITATSEDEAAAMYVRERGCRDGRPIYAVRHDRVAHFVAKRTVERA